MNRRYTAAQIAKQIEDEASDEEDHLSNGEASDSEDDFVPVLFDIDNDSEDDYISDADSNDDEPAYSKRVVYKAKDGTEWSNEAPRPATYRKANTVRTRSGLTPLTRNLTEPEEFFRFLFREMTAESIACHTNNRIEQDGNQVRRSHEYIDNDVTKDEVYAYCGTLLLLGVLRKRNIDTIDLWKSDSDNIHRVHQIVTTFSRERFRLLSRYLTFDDINSRKERAKNDRKYFKMSDVFYSFASQTKLAYEPGSHLCVDECLYSFRGRCSFVRYLPNKPAKYGLKFWIICDCDTRIILNIIPYVGKEGDTIQRGLARSVVMKLSRPFANAWRNITTDNYYTSVALADELWDNQFTLLGTLKRNSRGIPENAKQVTGREPSTTKFYFNGKLSVVSYCPKRNKVVLLLSTQHHDNAIDKHSKKPDMIECYNSTKGTVDCNDQAIGYYSARRKTHRWTMRTFHFIIDAAALNAYRLYRQAHNTSYLRENLGGRSTAWRRVFIEKLSEQLMTATRKSRFCELQNSQWRGCTSTLRNSFRICGLHGEETSPQPPPGTPQRCTLCGRTRDRKVKTICCECRQPTCAEHGKLLCNRH